MPDDHFTKHKKEVRYRICFDVNQVTRDRYNKAIPWGVSRRLLTAVVLDLLDLLESVPKPELLIGAILTRDMAATKYIKAAKEVYGDEEASS